MQNSLQPKGIETERLTLVPFSAKFIRASLAGRRDEAESLIGRALPREWPGDRRPVLGLRLSQIEHDSAIVEWLLRGICLKVENRLIGTVGFHDRPGNEDVERASPGAVEIGYEVESEYRRRGIGTEAVVALMNWAQASRGVTRFIASVRPDNVASLSMIARLSFRKLGHHMDTVDGHEDIFERVLS